MNCEFKMLPVDKVILAKGRERSVVNRHPWIFSGALERKPSCADGELVQVFSKGGELLGSGYYNSKTSIAVRLLAFGGASVEASLKANLESAVRLREQFIGGDTNCYRLVNGEGDGIPGLIVDRYADVLVLQVGTLGIERLKPQIVDWLVARLKPQTVVEKSSLPARAEEGLQDFEGLLYGARQERVIVKENGLLFEIDFAQSQKTGLFLDQREMRSLVGSLADGRRLLNCFAYTGGFSLYAARHGALAVDTVDISEAAVQQARRNFEINELRNELNADKYRFFAEDCFKFLSAAQGDYDFIILDPPAFAKKKAHVVNACRGYNDINRRAMQIIKPGGLLLTCSCSYYVDDQLFQQVIFQAARDAGRQVRILSQHRQAFDHPENIFHPEGHYLKSLLLHVAPAK